MTQNQINYQKHLEDVRSHKASEAISRQQAEAATKQAKAAERQADVAAWNAETNALNAETNRANSIINESAVGAQWYGAQANAAYQQAMAAVSQAQQQESVRHNKTAESQNLIVEGWKNTTNQYRIQKDAEIAREQMQTNKEITESQNQNKVLTTELQVRGNTVNNLISTTGSLFGRYHTQ